MSVQSSIGALLLATVAGSTTAANAQPVTSEISLKAAVSLRHDENIARTSAARAIARGIERQEQRISPSATLQLVRAFGRSNVSLGAAVGYDFHMRNPRLDRERIELTGSGLLATAFCSTSLSAALSRGQSNLGDVLAVPIDTPAAQRNARTTQDYSAFLSCGRSFGFRPSVEIGYSRGDNSNPLRELTDFRRMRYLAGLTYIHPSIGSALVFASQIETDLPKQVLVGRATGHEVKQIGLRLDRRVGARLQAQAEIAASKIETRGLAGGGRSGLTGRVSLTGIISPRVQATLGARRLFDNSADSDATYFVSNIVDLGLSAQLTERLRGQAGVSLQKRSYVYTGVPVLGLVDEEDQLSVSGGLNFTVNRRLQLGLSGGYERRNASGAFFDYDNSYAGLELSTTF